MVCRFRPICAAEVMGQSVKSSVVRQQLDEGRHNLAQSTCDNVAAGETVEPEVTNRRISRTLLLPSPSSAFSPPPARHTNTVPPTVCRNTDDDAPEIQSTQCCDTPDMSGRYRRRGTVREMAQSYDRATQNEVSARRLSSTFRPALPTNTTSGTSISESVAKTSQAMTAETTRDHYTTKSVFNLIRARPHTEKVGMTKPHETRLKRLYANTVASLYKSFDNFTRLQRPLAADGDKRNEEEPPTPTSGAATAAASSGLDLRRSASIQHITGIHEPSASHTLTNNNNNNNNMACTFPITSRRHSHSTHTITDLSTHNFHDMENSGDDVTVDEAQSTASTAGKNSSSSRWSVAFPETKLSDSVKPDTSSGVDVDEKRRGDRESKTAEMRVVLARNYTAEAAKTSRNVTVRQSPSMTTLSSLLPDDDSRGASFSNALSTAFVSPRPIRKLVHHVQPLTSSASSSRTRPTSAAALDSFWDAQQLLMKSADMPSSSLTSDVRTVKSSSPCQTLIELVRESHLSAFPSSKHQFPHSGAWNEHSGERGSKSVSSVSSSLTADDNYELALSPMSQFRTTPPARTTLQVTSPSRAYMSNFSPSAQPQRARIAVVSPHVSHVNVSKTAPWSTTATTTTYISLSNPASHRQQFEHRQQNHCQRQSTRGTAAGTDRAHTGDTNQHSSSTLWSSTHNQQVITSSSSSSLGASAAAARPAQPTTALSSSTPHHVTSIADRPRSQGHVQLSQGQHLTNDDSLLTNGFVTAALDCAIELLTLKQTNSRNEEVDQGHEVNNSRPEKHASNDDLAGVEMSQFLDEEPTPVLRDKPRSKSDKSS